MRPAAERSLPCDCLPHNSAAPRGSVPLKHYRISVPVSCSAPHTGTALKDRLLSPQVQELPDSNRADQAEERKLNQCPFVDCGENALSVRTWVLQAAGEENDRF